MPGNNVFSSVKADEFKRFYDKVAAHAKLVRRAQKETALDKTRELWQQVFGLPFPAAELSKSGLWLTKLAWGLTDTHEVCVDFDITITLTDRAYEAVLRSITIPSSGNDI